MCLMNGGGVVRERGLFIRTSGPGFDLESGKTLCRR